MVFIRKAIQLSLIGILFVVLIAAAVSALSISDVDVNSINEKKEAKPNENVTIDFTIENEDEDNDLESTSALVYFLKGTKKLEDDSGDEIEFDLDVGTLRAGKDKDMKVSFLVPFDVSDGNTYTVHIEVEGKNESNRDKLEATDESESFEIVESKHELMFYKLDISPLTINCTRTLTVYMDIRNIGQEDEDDINMTITNNLMGVKSSEVFALDSNYDPDNKFEKEYTYDIPNTVPAGTYALNVNLVYNNKNSHVYNATQIKVESCGATTTITPAATQPPATTQPAVTPSTTTPATFPAATAKKTEEGSNTMLYIIIGSELLIAVIIVLFVLLWRRK